MGGSHKLHQGLMLGPGMDGIFAPSVYQPRTCTKCPKPGSCVFVGSSLLFWYVAAEVHVVGSCVLVGSSLLFWYVTAEVHVRGSRMSRQRFI